MNGGLKSLEDGSTLYTFQATLSPRDTMFGYAVTSFTLR